MIERIKPYWDICPLADWDTAFALGAIPLWRIEPFKLPDVISNDAPYWGTIDELEVALKSEGYLLADRNHFLNPERANLDHPERDASEYGPNHWHTDSESGRSRGDDFICLIASDNPNVGTLISGPIDLEPWIERYRLATWVAYLIKGDTIHRAPQNAQTLGGCPSVRICFRWYQSEYAQATKNYDLNSRRDEDGKLIWNLAVNLAQHASNISKHQR